MKCSRYECNGYDDDELSHGAVSPPTLVGTAWTDSVMHYVNADGEGGTMLKTPDGGANPPIVAFVEDLKARPA